MQNKIDRVIKELSRIANILEKIQKTYKEQTHTEELKEFYNPVVVICKDLLCHAEKYKFNKKTGKWYCKYHYGLDLDEI